MTIDVVATPSLPSRFAFLRTFSFNNRDLSLYALDERPFVVALEMGQALGYDPARKFVENVRDNWSDELHTGRDYMLLEGDMFAEFKGLFDYTDSVSSPGGTRRVTVLFETGWNLALLRTRMDAGKVLRRKLADEVLPAITRTGSYTAPAPATAPPTKLAAPSTETLALEARMRECVTASRALDAIEPELSASLLAELRNVVGRNATLPLQPTRIVEMAPELVHTRRTGVAPGRPRRFDAAAVLIIRQQAQRGDSFSTLAQAHRTNVQTICRVVHGTGAYKESRQPSPSP